MSSIILQFVKKGTTTLCSIKYITNCKTTTLCSIKYITNCKAKKFLFVTKFYWPLKVVSKILWQNLWQNDFVTFCHRFSQNVTECHRISGKQGLSQNVTMSQGIHSLGWSNAQRYKHYFKYSLIQLIHFSTQGSSSAANLINTDCNMQTPSPPQGCGWTNAQRHKHSILNKV